MKYMGSKNKISKYIVPIIQSYVESRLSTFYIEPFVGGANVIDKIKCQNKIGYDINPYLIALLRKVQNEVYDLPATISEDEYNEVRDNRDKYSDWYVGLVGFCATFGAKFFGGYARGFKNDRVTRRDIPSESIRNLVKQAPSLKDIVFANEDYTNIRPMSSVIYCDIPYKGTTKYSNDFDYDKFYEWCHTMKSLDNEVLVSEYWMPDEFTCIWEKKIGSQLSKDNWVDRNERLYRL